MTEPTKKDDGGQALKERDVFRFSYSDAAIARMRSPNPYWCFDGQLIVRNGRLCDTYWAGHKLSAGGDERVVRPEDGDLQFICNLDDVQEIHESECRYYDSADIINLSHQHGCYRFFAIRKGTPKSQRAMLDWLDKKAECLRGDITLSRRHLEQIAAQREEVAAGRTEVSIG